MRVLSIDPGLAGAAVVISTDCVCDEELGLRGCGSCQRGSRLVAAWAWRPLDRKAGRVWRVDSTWADEPSTHSSLVDAMAQGCGRFAPSLVVVESMRPFPKTSKASYGTLCEEAGIALGLYGRTELGGQVLRPTAATWQGWLCGGGPRRKKAYIDDLAARKSSSFGLPEALVTEHVHAALQMACWSLREGLLVDSLA